MKKKLKITLFQTNIDWNNKLKNLFLYEKLLDKITTTDLALFPELFDTGFVTNVDILNKAHNKLSVNWLKQQSNKRKFSIGASSLFYESKRFFNRFMVCKPDENIEFYNKKHLFSISGEDEHISFGNERKIIKLNNWRLNLNICYDLRFPVWTRNKDDYDILIFIANWPTTRIAQWETLLKARAIENQTYVVGVNRIGVDANNYKYCGKSMVVNPKGEIMYQAKKDVQEIATVTLDFDLLQKLRTNFPVHKDADKFFIV